MQIGFAILLSDEAHNYSRRLELEISRLFNTRSGLKQSPHITIKFPFEINKLPPYEKYFSDLAKTTKPFVVEIDGIAYFEPHVIYLRVVENQNLRDLRFRVIKDLESQFGVKPGDWDFSII